MLAQALIGSHCRGRWVAVDESVGFLVRPVQALKGTHAFTTLSSIALHQQMLQTDQLSAMYTLSKGGGWRGVTFDANTSKRPCKALEGFGPRLRTSHAKRKQFARVGSRATAADSTMDVGNAGKASQALPGRPVVNSGVDEEIPVAAVLDFQRFVSSSARPSLDSAQADEVIEEAQNGSLADNVVFNRYSVSANLHLLKSMSTLNELEFEEEQSNSR